MERDALDHVADLARLGPYPAARKEKLKAEFGRILELFKALDKIPSGKENDSTEETLPWLDAAGTPLREDKACTSPARERIIANFPDKESALLKVPKVIE